MSRNSEIKHGEKITVLVDFELEGLIPGFLEDWKKEVSIIHKALEKNEYETIRKLAHDMKGTGGACGLYAITDIGRALEEGAKSMDAMVIRKNVDMLSSYLRQVEVVYE